jgi:hypothetical protein
MHGKRGQKTIHSVFEKWHPLFFQVGKVPVCSGRMRFVEDEVSRSVSVLLVESEFHPPRPFTAETLPFPLRLERMKAK